MRQDHVRDQSGLSSREGFGRKKPEALADRLRHAGEFDHLDDGGGLRPAVYLPFDDWGQASGGHALSFEGQCGHHPVEPAHGDHRPAAVGDGRA